jgi:hypothetical protein
MSDLVVTVPKNLWIDWVTEGDAAGQPDSGEEWGFYLGGARPDIEPGEHLYIVAWGRVRGYSPVTRVVQAEGRWVICRRGGAVACAIPKAVSGFRGWRRRWWDRSVETPFAFPNWITDGVPAGEFANSPRSFRESIGLL